MSVTTARQETMVQGVEHKGKRKSYQCNIKAANGDRAREWDPSSLQCCTEINTINRMPWKCWLEAAHGFCFSKNKLMLAESELRICSLCIRQVISMGKVLENLLWSSAVSTENILWSQQLPWQSPGEGLPRTGLTSHRQSHDSSLATTFNSPESQRGSSWQTQKRVALASFQGALSPLNGGERLLLADRN